MNPALPIRGLQRLLTTRDRLLLRLACRTDEVTLNAREAAILSDPALQDEFFTIAALHGVHGLVLATLADPRWCPPVPQDLAKRARGSVRQLRSVALLWDLERDRLAAYLSSQGLLPVMLKGAALRHTVYPDPALRPVTDLDLLLAREQVDDAVEALHAIGYRSPGPEGAIEGYRQHHFHVRLANSNGFIVEVHWGLIRPDRPFALDATAFLGRASICRRPTGPDLKIPSPEDMILHIASQNMEGFFRLGRLVDIHRVLVSFPELDWDYLRSSARAGRLEIPLAISARLCQGLIETPMPESALRRLLVPFGTRVHLAMMKPARWPFAQREERTAAANLRLFWCVRGWRLRRQLIGEILGGSRDLLQWLWDAQPGKVPTAPARFKGISSLSKLAAYQAWLYASAAVASLSANGRRDLRFWGRCASSPEPVRGSTSG